MSLNQFLIQWDFPVLVVPVSYKFYKYQTVYKKLKFIKIQHFLINWDLLKKFQCLAFLKCTFLTLPLPSFLVPTPFTKGGRPDPSDISNTIFPMNLKFCRVLETSLNVLEM